MKRVVLAALAAAGLWGAAPAGATPMYLNFAISGYAICENGSCPLSFPQVSFSATVLFDPAVLPTTSAGLPIIQAIGANLDVAGKSYSGPFTGTFRTGDPTFPVQTPYPFLFLEGPFDAHFAITPQVTGTTIGALYFNINGSSYGIEHSLYTVTAVPETATWAMMMVGLGVIGGALRARRRTVTRLSYV